MKKNKIIFFGTPELGAAVLQSLLENNFEVVAVITQADKKIGRRQEITFSPVKKLALEKNIQIFQPEKLSDENIISEVKNLESDLFVVAAYGKILPKNLLDIPRFGSINVHPSLLPKFRGPTPVPAALLAGEKETGVTLILMNEKMDEGDILAQEKIAIEENETADLLMERLSRIAEKMIARTIPDWIDGKIKPVSQNNAQATYCPILKREDGKVDWSDASQNIYNKWRAYQPWPGIFSILSMKNGMKRIKITEVELIVNEKAGEMPGEIVRYNERIVVQAKGGLIILKKIQPEGKKEMPAEDFSKGSPDFIGKIFQ
jgi:methionyl-tRNA formyltransferase